MKIDRGAIPHVWLPALVGLLALAEIFRSAPGPHDLLRFTGLLLALFGLAGIILAGLPGTAAWAIGLLVGINLVFGGTALISMALHARGAKPAPLTPAP